MTLVRNDVRPRGQGEAKRGTFWKRIAADANVASVDAEMCGGPPDYWADTRYGLAGSETLLRLVSARTKRHESQRSGTKKRYQHDPQWPLHTQMMTH